ncbi:MAG: urease accessory protein UreD [Terrimesophilobacter sp.]
MARVSLTSGAAGPLGGDDFVLEVRVGRGSTLVLNEVSSTLLLPGARGGVSQMRITITVEEYATLVWLPEPVIAAEHCNHVHDIDVALETSSRFLMRDELQLGRHREPPGNFTQRIRVRRTGRPLFHQHLTIGPATRGWRSSAVGGSHKALGTVLVVDPDWSEKPVPTHILADSATLFPLAGPAVLISALADDSLAIRRLLDRGVAWLGDPWASTAATAESA